MENNRNFFITIALSVLILTLWQVFYMNPRIEAQREAARIEAGARRQSRRRPAAARPAPACRAPTPAAPPQGAVPGAAGRRRRRAETRRRPHRRQPARQDRHAEPVGLDQPDRRAASTTSPEALPRDRRQDFADDRAAQPAGAAERLFCRDRLCRQRRRPAPCPAPTRVWTRRGQPDADADDAGHADLHQRQGPDLQAHHLASTPTTCSPSPTRSAMPAPRRSRCPTTAASRASTSRPSPASTCCTKA